MSEQMQIVNVVEKVVDGTTYQVFRLDPFLALRLKARLVKRLLPALGALVADGKVESLFDKEMDISAALTVLAAQMDEKELEETVKTFITPIARDGQRINPVTEFTGHDNLMLKLFWAALEVNYSDFFGSLPGMWDRLEKVLEKSGLNREQRRSTKSGRAGESGSRAKPRSEK